MGQCSSLIVFIRQQDMGRYLYLAENLLDARSEDHRYQNITFHHHCTTHMNRINVIKTKIDFGFTKN